MYEYPERYDGQVEYDGEAWERAQEPVRRPKTIRCCEQALTLWSSWANECPHCGTEYNGDGQALAPRDQWGEETGERF